MSNCEVNSLKCTWQAFGKDMARYWQGYGKVLASIWQVYGKYMASIWQAHGLAIYLRDAAQLRLNGIGVPVCGWPFRLFRAWSARHLNNPTSGVSRSVGYADTARVSACHRHAIFLKNNKETIVYHTDNLCFIILINNFPKIYTRINKKSLALHFSALLLHFESYY